LCLQSLPYLIDNPAELSLVGDTGECGTIMVNLMPLDENGEQLGDKADYIEDPQELLERRIDFSMNIDYAKLPENFCQDTYCEYTLLCDDGIMKDFKTAIIHGKNSRPAYNYSFQHTYKSLDQKILTYLLNHYLNIKVYGYEIPEESKDGFLSPGKSILLSNSGPNEDSDQKAKKRSNTALPNTSPEVLENTKSISGNNMPLTRGATINNNYMATKNTPNGASNPSYSETQNQKKKKEDCTIF